MSKYKIPDFEKIELEVTQSLSTLKRHGIRLNIPEQLTKKISHTSLFDGSDGLFKELIKNINVYFEYGCGKSTEYVYKYTSAKIFSVDTSEFWANKILQLNSLKNSDRLNIRYIDVGEIGDWGTPLTFEKRLNFKSYAENLFNNSINPDLILIDGRFRILCFLTSLKLAPVSTKILFDDYTNRKLYHVVEEIIKPIEICGRQALFEVNQNVKDKINKELLDSFQNVII
jgi:hypothetical protein